MNKETLISTLKANGLKATPQRLAVHEAMMSLGHASADQVADYIEKRSKARITMASIYNTLCQLALIGVYSFRHSATNKMFFDVNTFPHFHIYDKQNDFYMDVVDDELYQFIEAHLKGKKFRGYTVEGFDLNILCHKNKSTNTR